MEGHKPFLNVLTVILSFNEKYEFFLKNPFQDSYHQFRFQIV